MVNTDIIDINSLIHSKNKSSKNWNNHNFLFNRISNILGDKLPELGHQFDNILLLSSDGGEAVENIMKISFKNLIFLSPYKDLLKKKNILSRDIFKVEGNFENIPCKDKKFDLIISNLCLHNINEKKNHLTKIFRLLNNNGLLICNFFGEKTMHELKTSLFVTDEKFFKGTYMRLPPSLKMVGISDLLSEVGFNELVSEKISFKIYYENIKKIFEDIKGIGESKILIDRKKSLMTKNYLDSLNLEYKKNFSNKYGLRLTCDVISVSGWKNTSR